MWQIFRRYVLPTGDYTEWEPQGKPGQYADLAEQGRQSFPDVGQWSKERAVIQIREVPP